MDNKDFNEENNLKIHRGESKQKDNIEEIMESENRKQQSIDILKKSNIPYIDEPLPDINASIAFELYNSFFIFSKTGCIENRSRT